MLTADQVYGVIPAIITPFTDDDRVDTDALVPLTDYVISRGVHAIMTTGGTGEFPHLSGEERRLVTETVAAAARGRVPVIAGTAACSTKEAIQLTNDAAEAGAAAAIVTAPYYFKLPVASLAHHYREIARSSSIPIVLYNNPLYTGNDLPPGLIADLADVPGIIGLKQSNPDMGQLVEVIRLVGDRISICTGIDSQFYPSLCVGGRGIFSTAATVIPREMAQVYKAFESGSYGEATVLHMRVQALNRFLEYDPGYVSPCKEALRMLGFRTGPVRSPMPDLTDDERAGVKQALKGLGYEVG
ncbi:MAG: 4-hydroxy-tetrahydrodipicolinate synthase [Candidatus Latescibacteria bacterium]|nr:4-hydroxy-tetrahydrodipicolinate synthase [Candidatus Latescibacterota bacterium]